jgi:hypothetical protein
MQTGYLGALQSSWLSSVLGDSRYVPMAFQTLHVLGFICLLAVVIAFNIRVQKVAFKGTSVRDFVVSLNWPYRFGVVLTLGAGFLLFLPRAVAYGSNWAFDYKIVILFAALIVQFSLNRQALAAVEGREASGFFRLASVVSLLLWFTAGVAGRAIGFVA